MATPSTAKLVNGNTDGGEIQTACTHVLTLTINSYPAVLRGALFSTIPMLLTIYIPRIRHGQLVPRKKTI